MNVLHVPGCCWHLIAAQAEVGVIVGLAALAFYVYMIVRSKRREAQLDYDKPPYHGKFEPRR